MADQVSSKVAELSWAIGKFLVKASGVGLLADLSDVARKLCELLPALIKNEDGDVNNDVAEQINKVLTSKIRNMYGRPTVNKELLEVAATEVKFLLDQIIDDDKLLVFAVKNPDSFSDLLRKLAYARQLEIEQEAEPYFRELVDVVKEQYVKVVPWSSEFDKAALKYLLASNEQALTRLDQVYELLEDTNKEVKNSNAKLDYVKEAVNDIPDKVVARMESKFSTPMREPFTFGVRPDVAAFYIERGERERLHDLAIEGQQPRIVLTGMRGCGKSQLASDLAQRCEKQEWSFVVWINAVSRESVQSDLVELAQRLPIDRSDKPTQDQLINRCLDYFKSANDTGRLIVFDNVEDINHLIGLVPSGDGLRVVATTTNEYGWKNQSWKPIKIGVFSREDSIECLLRITDSKDRKAADAVAQRLGDLPLAIAQAGATAYEEDFTLNEYLTCLDDYSSRAGHGNNEIIRPIGGDSYTDGAFDALFMAANVALNKLGDRLCEVGRRQLGGLALLAQSGVPTRWIVPLPDDNRRALTRLVKMSVVQQSADETKTITMLHRLQAQVLRANWGKGKTATCEEAFDAAVEILGRTKFEQLPSNATDARRCEVRDLITQLSAIAIQDYSRLLFEREQVRSYLNRAFEYADDLGLVYEAVELEVVVAVVEDVLDPDHPDTLGVRNDLAGAYESAGRFGEAIELFERVLAECKRLLGADHPDTLSVRNNLAGAYESAGRFAEAIDAWEELLLDCQRVLGADHPDTLNTRNNLAVAYRSVGRFGEAIELFERVLAERERVLGADHPDTLNTRNNLAGAYESVGRFGEAIELFEQVLAEYERVLGADHPDTLKTRNNLAGAYYSVGRFGEAIELFEQVLDERKRLLGADHPDTLSMRNNLAGAYESVGRFGEAIELFEQVLDERKRLLGADHPDTLETRNNLAGAYLSVGRFGEAIELYEQVLAERERLLGADHPDTLNTRNNLAGAYLSVGRLAEAIDAWEELLPDCQRVLGREHPLTKLVQKNLEAAKRKMNPPGASSE